jgi:hypothetical protein
MDDAEVVRASKRGAHLLEDIDASSQRHSASRKLAREGRADEVFHHEVELSVLRLSDVVDIDDVRVVDAVGRARFAKHPRSKVRLAAQVGADQFHRDDAIDEHVARAIYDAHAPFSDSRFETVAARDDAAEHRIRRLGRLRKSLCHDPPCRSSLYARGSNRGQYQGGQGPVVRERSALEDQFQNRQAQLGLAAQHPVLALLGD